MTKREQIESMAGHFFWLYKSDKEMAINKIQENCTDEEVAYAYESIKKEMTDYMMVEVAGYYFQPLYKKAMEAK